MLEHVPHWLGGLLRNVRAGHSRLVVAQDAVVTDDTRIDLASMAFGNGDRLPIRFTADGDGVSPPLHWRGVPEGAAGLALIVEDPDAPAPNPLVHAILWGIPAEETMLAEGALTPDDGGDPDGRDVGLNSYRREGWLPPDPPTGHGTHDYVFQLFALSELPQLGPDPGRRDVVEAIRGRVMAVGLLTGTYSRGEEADVPVGAVQPA